MSTHTNASQEPNRRDFLYVATSVVGATGAAAFIWPFIDQMRPDASTRALATVEVDISDLEPGQAITVKWQGKPIFIRNRTEQEINEARGVALSNLKDPLAQNGNLDSSADASNENRSVEGQENLIIMIGVCTHLGCVPIGLAGDFGGWYCPCHGSHYDTAGRIRKGPAPRNLDIPAYTFVSDTVVKIG